MLITRTITLNLDNFYSGVSDIIPYYHNITPDNVLFCYVENDNDSLNVAEYYSQLRQVPENNFLALPCSTNHTITEADYISTIEQPILNYIANGDPYDPYNPYFTSNLYVIILGYKVPNIYITSGGDSVAVASRLIRLNHTASSLVPNPTYNRTAKFEFFDQYDAQNVIITAVIDAETKELAKELIYRGYTVSKEKLVTGSVYINAYGKQADDYQTTLNDFVINEIPNTGLSVVQTVQNSENPYEYGDPYYSSPIQVYSQIQFFQNESFYFGRSQDYYSSSLYLNQAEKRIFSYNQDDVSASNIRSPLVDNVGNWCNVAINAGYAACAGAITGTTVKLMPRPFFEALHHGATLGEAFLFALPYVESNLILIGDPLITLQMPYSLPKWQDETYTLLRNDDAIIRNKRFIEKGLAYGAREVNLIEELVNDVVSSGNLNDSVNLLTPFNGWKNHRSIDYWKQIYATLINEWCRYTNETTGLSIDDFLSSNSETVSPLFAEISLSIGTPISSTYEKPSGLWEYEFQYIHSALTYEKMNFEIAVYSDCSFTNQIKSIISSGSGWWWESEYNEFSSMTDGFMSNFSGRRVKYISPSSQYLTPLTIYYIRWRSIDSSGNYGSWNTIDDKRLIVE